ncbi:ABC transporter permease [Pseudoduganella umbonata]|uniref:ABC transporter permease n=1 Tax=Pseudoduganella umbonata TaxID=864828 RepID=A0A4P8HYT7_9BURK|nr:ABC transporter permease [Pseudoduganella umbonata]MBB3223539.1 peptide/nickel transport system permease protein [Pseudoduganella umbonata]QCP13585.1 ABC transporter permease [Pseudoduganella umbonata]
MTLFRGAPGVWTLAWRRLRADRLAMAALAVVAGWLVLVALSAAGLVAAGWEREVGVSYAPPSFLGASGSVPIPAPASISAARGNPFDPLAADLAALRAALPDAAATQARRATLPFGADKWGHDIVQKTIKGAETSIVVGLVAAFVAVGLGTLAGALAGYFGGIVDDLFEWLYSVFTAIPAILMILTVAAVLQTKGVGTIVLILGLTGWTGPYRLMRAEYLRHRRREYVLAAQAIGASAWRRMFAHIFPNVSHVALVQVSILVVGFIKAEVILSFLGFGVPAGVVSWGSMLNEAQNELLLGKWWQLTAAATAMALLVTAFSLVADALRDALDPKVKA